MFAACMFMAFYLGVGILAAIGEGSIQERTWVRKYKN